MTDTLADALPREIARVTAKKERWIGYCKDMPPNFSLGMQPTIHLMRMAIERGVSALASGDVSEMLRAHADLADFNEDD